MGANATTFVPAYVAGEVLTAADLSVTNSGIPVFATTVTRDAAFGGTGEKTLAEGQFAYIEATNTTQYYDGAAWQSVGVAPGLVLVKSQTIGTTVASVTVSDAFSSTYDNYKIVISGGSGSTAARLNISLGATATGYYNGVVGYAFSNSLVGIGLASTSNFDYAGYFNTDGLSFNAELINPNLAKNTFINGQYNENKTNGSGFNFSGYLANTTAYTAFTIGASSGTLTGGTIRVYGYANS
jgi:hypothetical protein